MFNDVTLIVNGDNAVFMHVNSTIVLNKRFFIFYILDYIDPSIQA